jgi:class 3 adenylate cyclase
VLYALPPLLAFCRFDDLSELRVTKTLQTRSSAANAARRWPRAHATEQRKVVTVVLLGCDGSTALGERLDPESLRRCSRVTSSSRARSSTATEESVEKFIGDAVMAVFGVPQVHEDDALRAVRRRRSCARSLEALNGELERDYATSLSVRMGINTGEVVTGHRGSASRRETRSTSPRR